MAYDHEWWIVSISTFWHMHNRHGQHDYINALLCMLSRKRPMKSALYPLIIIIVIVIQLHYLGNEFGRTHTMRHRVGGWEDMSVDDRSIDELNLVIIIIHSLVHPPALHTHNCVASLSSVLVHKCIRMIVLHSCTRSEMEDAHMWKVVSRYIFISMHNT